jgi:hypothetical protein
VCSSRGVLRYQRPTGGGHHAAARCRRWPSVSLLRPCKIWGRQAGSKAVWHIHANWHNWSHNRLVLLSHTKKTGWFCCLRALEFLTVRCVVTWDHAHVLFCSRGQAAARFLFVDDSTWVQWASTQPVLFFILVFCFWVGQPVKAWFRYTCIQLNQRMLDWNEMEFNLIPLQSTSTHVNWYEYMYLNKV